MYGRIHGRIYYIPQTRICLINIRRLFTAGVDVRCSTWQRRIQTWLTSIVGVDLPTILSLAIRSLFFRVTRLYLHNLVLAGPGSTIWSLSSLGCFGFPAT